MFASLSRRGLVTAAPLILAFGASCSHSGSSSTALPATAPGPPSNVRLTPEEGALSVAWNAAPDADSYNVYLAAERRVGTTNWRTLHEGSRIKGATSPFSWVGLKDGVEYSVVVSSVNENGEGEGSTTRSARPAIGAGRPALDETGGRVGARGVMVSAKSRALWKASEVAIEPHLERQPLPLSLVAAAPSVNVKLKKPLASNAPFQIQIGYDEERVSDESNLFAVQWNEREREWEAAGLVELDAQADTVTVETRSSSIVQLVEPVAALPSSFSLPFVPATDGWAMANFGHYYAAGGNALGMAAYAAWHFDNEPDVLTQAFSSAGDPSTAELLATRAQLAQAQTSLSLTFQSNTLGAARTGQSMKRMLSDLGDPLVLVMGGPGRRHAAVVFGYDETGFDIYDADFPGSTQRLGFNGTSFVPYRGCRNFGFLTSPSLGRSEDFAYLAGEARNDFEPSHQMTIASPAQDELISAHEVSLSGALGGTLQQSTGLMAFVKGIPQMVGVNGGAFAENIPVANGMNTIIALADVQPGPASLWFKDTALLIRDFEGALPRTELAITLTWDQADTDVDLYCIDPSGEAAWYGARQTSSGVTLDFDDTSGFGPEYATLTAGPSGGQILPGQYRIRVHYFDDNFTGQAATGSVNVILKEGTPHQYMVSLPFRIELSNRNAGGPQGGGASWREIAIVDLQAGTIAIP